MPKKDKKKEESRSSSSDSLEVVTQGLDLVPAPQKRANRCRDKKSKTPDLKKRLKINTGLSFVNKSCSYTELPEIERPTKEERRLDSLARLLEGQGKCAAVFIDSQGKLKVATNDLHGSSKDNKHTEFIKRVLTYLHNLSNGSENGKEREEIIKAICIEGMKAQLSTLAKTSFNENTLDVIAHHFYENIDEKGYKGMIESLSVQNGQQILDPASNHKRISREEFGKMMIISDSLICMQRDFRKVKKEVEKKGSVLRSTIQSIDLSSGIGNVVIREGNKGLHAEMRILDHFIGTNEIDESYTNPIYIGISKLCCRKCIKVMYLVNKKTGWEMSGVKIRGFHTVFAGEENWVEPEFFKSNPDIAEEFRQLELSLRERPKMRADTSSSDPWSKSMEESYEQMKEKVLSKETLMIDITQFALNAQMKQEDLQEINNLTGILQIVQPILQEAVKNNFDNLIFFLSAYNEAEEITIINETMEDIFKQIFVNNEKEKEFLKGHPRISKVLIDDLFENKKRILINTIGYREKLLKEYPYEKEYETRLNQLKKQYNQLTGEDYSAEGLQRDQQLAEKLQYQEDFLLAQKLQDEEDEIIKQLQSWGQKRQGMLQSYQSNQFLKNIALAIVCSQLDQSNQEHERNLFGLRRDDNFRYNIGDCLFQAIAVQLEGMDVQAVRSAAIEAILDNLDLQEYINASIGPDSFIITPQGEKRFENLGEYTQIMAQDRSWGTEIEIVAISHILQIPIVILTPNNLYDRIIGEEHKQKNEPIFLNFVNGNHYEPLIANGQDKLAILQQIKENNERRHQEQHCP